MSCNFAAVPSLPMPFKFIEAQRHHIPKARHRVQNWPDYDGGLVRRGNIRVWLSEDAIAGWRAACRTTPGGQRRFSNLAIETNLMLGAVMRLPLRQTEGFVCWYCQLAERRSREDGAPSTGATQRCPVRRSRARRPSPRNEALDRQMTTWRGGESCGGWRSHRGWRRSDSGVGRI